MSSDPKDVVQRFYEAFNDHNLDLLDELCAPDFKGHAGAGADLEQLKSSMRTFLEAFPDLRSEVRHVIGEGDMVSTWITYVGTHEETFAGVPGTGRAVKAAGWDLFRVVDGEIAELTQYCDLFTLMNQIGALPTAAPA